MFTIKSGLLSALIFATALASNSYAQESTSGRDVGRTTFGGFWSSNVATVSFKPSSSEVRHQQWSGGGVTADVSLTSHVSLDVRAMANRKGARLLLADSVCQDVMADYVSLPVLIKFSAGSGVRTYLVSGLETAVRTRARIRTVVGTSAITEDAAAAVRRLDLALNVGGGVERRTGRARVFVEGLYAWGLRNVLADPPPTDSASTRTLTLLAGVRF